MRKRRSTSPAQRSLAQLRKQGYLAAVVERWNAFAGVRQDLFGFADILCVRGSETLAVQTTTAKNVPARLKKLREIPAVGFWLLGGTRRLVVHGWAKRGPRGKRKRWELREVEITPRAS
jgi:hypothetical protein